MLSLSIEASLNLLAVKPFHADSSLRNLAPLAQVSWGFCTGVWGEHGGKGQHGLTAASLYSTH